MLEKERSSRQGTRSELEKAGKIALVAGAVALLAGCTREGEPVPTIEEAAGPEPTPAGIQIPEVLEEIKVTQEAFGGSMIEETQDLILESTQSLDLGVEKTNAIVTEAKEMGLDTEEMTYTGFYKVDEAGNRELVVMLHVPSKEEEGMKDHYYVSGREGNKYVPIGTSSQVELLEMREYEDGEKTMFGFEEESGDVLPVMELTGMGVSYYTDPYTRIMTRMSEELSSEIMATVTSTPEGSIELIHRLGEEARIVLNESGKYDLIYNETVIGELDNEKQISFQVEEETVSISTESLEVKDGVLVSINRQRTEEMGVDWVEQVWTIGGERIVVPEPEIRLPETYEETLIVKEQSLDYFMPKLLAMEKKWLDENGWPGGDQNNARVAFPAPEKNIGLPYAERWFNIFKMDNGGEVVFTSWTRVQMSSGKVLDFMGVPFEPTGGNLRSLDGNYVWHFICDNNARVNWLTSQEYDFDVSTRRLEYVFDVFNSGQKNLGVRMFFDAREVEGWEEKYGWTEDRKKDSIEKSGFEDIDILMGRISLNIPGYSEIMGKTMLSTEGGHSSKVPPDGFMEDMERQLIPSLGIYGYY